MPKSLVLGNGNVLVGLDSFAQVSDFYYPNVGLENQAGIHHTHKIGVFVDGRFSWLDDGTWDIKIGYQKDSLVSAVEAFNHNLKVKLEFSDAVYNEKDIFLREVTVFNLSDEKRRLKIFFHAQFEIYGASKGDTAYYDPILNALVHYKGRRVFLINLISDVERFDDYSIGNFSTEGKEGTFRDAEDGKLSKNPIEHGLVDSVVGFTSVLNPQDSNKLYYWIACAKLVEDAKALNEYILTKTPAHLIRTTTDFWKAWVNREHFNFADLDPNLVELFKKSLLIIRTQVDNGGAIIASCDSDMLQQGKDNYSYMWPRDGSLVAIALDRVGDNNVARRFFEFCNEVLTPDGYFMHKYRADKSLGSSWHPFVHNGAPELPIQEDETALVIIALKKHFETSKDLEFIEGVYNSLIKKGADFMCSFRDPKTGLPNSSYDLWEEKFGSHTFSAAATYGALMAASEFASLLGKSEASETYKNTAQQVKEAILKYLWDDSNKYFYKMAQFTDAGLEYDYTVDASSAYGIFRFGVLDPDDPMLQEAFKTYEEKLAVRSDISGIMRYQGDQYYRVSQDYPENPWFITSLWLAQYKIATAKTKTDLKSAEKWMDWTLKHALTSGVLSEQLNPETGQVLSAAPLTWSHSEFVNTVIDYVEKVQTLGDEKPIKEPLRDDVIHGDSVMIH